MTDNASAEVVIVRSDSPATLHDDFEIIGTTTLSFANRATTAEVTLDVKGDDLVEPDETVTLAFGKLVGAQTRLAKNGYLIDHERRCVRRDSLQSDSRWQ